MKKLLIAVVLLALAVAGEARPVRENLGPGANRDDQYRFTWHIPWREAQGYFDAGFNLVVCGNNPKWLYTTNEAARVNETAALRDLITRGGEQGVEFVMQLPVVLALNRSFAGKVPEEFAFFEKSGKPRPGWVDRNRTATRQRLVEYTEWIARTMTNLNAIVGVQAASELSSSISWSPEFTERCQRELGHPPLKEYGASNGGIWRARDFPLSCVLEEDHPILRYFRWLHKSGFPNIHFQDECCEAFSRVVGRPLFQWYDPIVRSQPMWQASCGRDVDLMSHWFYPAPRPYTCSYMISSEQAKSRGRPGSQVLIMIQGFCYDRDLVNKRQLNIKNLPAWLKGTRLCGGISTPGEMMGEAQWMMFARKLDGYGVYECGVFYPRATTKDVPGQWGYETISNLYCNVGIPLGPLFKAVPERAPEVAVLESDASTLLAGGGCSWGWGSALGDALTRANMTPYVLYEEEIARDGLPPSLKVIVANNCPVLTKKTVAALKAFQARGGLLLSSGLLPPVLLANDKMPPLKREAIRDAFAEVFTPYADSENTDLIVHARSYRAADYVFAINDRRTWGDYVGVWRKVAEKGLPNEGVVTVARADTKAVYDLVKHAEVPFKVAGGKTEIPVSYTTCDGRALLVVPQKLGSLTIRREGDEVVVTSADKDVMIPIKVEVDGAKPRYGVVAGGVWKRPYATGAKLRVTNLADGKTFW